ncbi:MAG: TolC family protein [Acidobacteriota bacterium]
MHRANILACLLLLAVLPGAAWTTEPALEPSLEDSPESVFEPSAFGPPLTLEDAIERTLALDPEIRRAAEDVAERRGLWLEEGGLFDNRLQLELGYQLDRQQLIGEGLQREIERRQLLELSAGALELTGDQILARLAGQNVGDRPIEIRDQCDELAEDPLIVETETGSIVVCRGLGGQIAGLILPGGAAAGLDLNELLDDDLRAGVRRVIETGIATRLRTTADLLLRTADALRAQRARLGDLPEVVEQVRFDLRLAYEARLRSGLVASPFLAVMNTEENYEGKPHDPDLGDSRVPNLFTSEAGLELTMPLGKGRGRTAATAAERAAEAGLRAAEALALHVAAEQVLATTDAYWRVAAAQRRVAWQSASGTARTELLELTDLMIEGDELAPAERSLVAARTDQARADIAAARQAWVAARQQLALAIGLPSSAPLPVAVDGALEVSPKAADGALDAVPAEWLVEIETRRDDLRAARHAAEASRILLEAAELNLRHQIDLSLFGSYNVLHESFDERAWDFAGLVDAWEGEVAGPSYGFRIIWKVPLRNRAARGQLLQAEASMVRSAVTEDDLERSIRLQIQAAHRALGEARAELAEAERTVAAQRKVLDTSRSLFRAGEETMVDVLLTEEQLTAARLAQVAVAERVAILDAQLRFAAGRLEVPVVESAGGGGA